MSTESGHEKIENIEIGDQVWAYNEETGEQELKEVVTLFRNKADTTYTAYINIEKNGNIETEQITSTDEHPYYILNDTLCIDKKRDGYWVAAKDLVEGMRVLLYNCFIGIVGKVEREIHEIPVDTFNFEVADSHTYYVGSNSILVHNMCAVDTPVDDMLQFQSQELLEEHFAKHINDFKGLYTNSAEYLNGANFVIKNGTYVPEMNAYLRYFGTGSQGAEYAFVGLTRDGANITTYGVRNIGRLGKVPWIIK